MFATLRKTSSESGPTLTMLGRTDAGSEAPLETLSKTGAENTRRGLNVRGVYGALEEAQGGQVMVHRSDGYFCDGFDIRGPM